MKKFCNDGKKHVLYDRCYRRGVAMNEFSFVDLEKFCPEIQLDVIYATPNNFAKEILYPLAKCFLRYGVAQRLARVQKELENMGLGLKVFDGYRPHHVTVKFWNLIQDIRYVADPKLGSKHNRGAAVDVTLVDFSGKELEMPTPIDEMTERAHRDYDKLSKKVLRNRELLKEIMVKQGFVPLPTEWWHFDDQEWEKYPIEDICLLELAKHV